MHCFVLSKSDQLHVIQCCVLTQFNLWAGNHRHSALSYMSFQGVPGISLSTHLSSPSLIHKIFIEESCQDDTQAEGRTGEVTVSHF